MALYYKTTNWGWTFEETVEAIRKTGLPMDGAFHEVPWPALGGKPTQAAALVIGSPDTILADPGGNPPAHRTSPKGARVVYLAVIYPPGAVSYGKGTLAAGSQLAGFRADLKVVQLVPDRGGQRFGEVIWVSSDRSTIQNVNFNEVPGPLMFTPATPPAPVLATITASPSPPPDAIAEPVPPAPPAPGTGEKLSPGEGFKG